MLIEVYTDGSGTSFGSPGGWAYVVVIDGVKVHENNGSEKDATNNTMELRAAIEGLKFVQAQTHYAGAEVVLISDSQLVLNFAADTWKCKKMHLALLASNLKNLYKSLSAKGRWVKGHSGDTHNERCDELAKAARHNCP